MAVCQNLVPLVNIKIAGKWMFIPLKMYLQVLIHSHILDSLTHLFMCNKCTHCSYLAAGGHCQQRHSSLRGSDSGSPAG